jgi:hypothetical protein
MRAGFLTLYWRFDYEIDHEEAIPGGFIVICASRSGSSQQT